MRLVAGVIIGLVIPVQTSFRRRFGIRSPQVTYKARSEGWRG